MSTQTQDATHVPMSRAQQLAQDAAAAAEVRAFSEHPDVVALRVEKVRTQIDALMWLGIALGLAFTMVNVQTFAAAGAAVWSLPWLAAWLLDPMVSLVLVAVLRAEQVTARYQVETGLWVQRTKRFAFAATYVMNTWQSWAVLHAAGIVLHSVPPLLVYLASESAPVLRDRLTEAVLRAAGHRAGEPFTNTPQGVSTDLAVNPAAEVHEPATTEVHEQASAPVREPAKRPRRKTSTKPKAGRKLRGDYLADARAAWAPGIEITPAWIRQATGCSRGLSVALAADLRAETTDRHTTDYTAAEDTENERRAA